MTCFEQVCRDIRRKREDDSFNMGKLYYRNMRTRWEPSNCAFAGLQPDEDTVHPINQDLVNCFVAIKKCSTNLEPITLYLARASLCNSTELIGLGEWFIKLCRTEEKQLTAGLEFMRYMYRVKLKTHFPKQATQTFRDALF